MKQLIIRDTLELEQKMKVTAAAKRQAVKIAFLVRYVFGFRGSREEGGNHWEMSSGLAMQLISNSDVKKELQKC
jgi:hypothetical protein